MPKMFDVITTREQPHGRQPPPRAQPHKPPARSHERPPAPARPHERHPPPARGTRDMRPDTRRESAEFAGLMKKLMRE